MNWRGVVEAQIDAASGHAGEGANKRDYRHLRSDHLDELITVVEDCWQEMRRFASVNLRYQCHQPCFDTRR